MPTSIKKPAIAYSCYVARSREGEQFIPEFVFSYQVSGSMTMNDGNREYFFGPGSFRFSRRNNLIKFNKTPPEGGEFRSLSVHFDQPFLRNFSMEAGYRSGLHVNGDAVMELEPNPLYKNYFDSLMPYMQLNGIEDEALLALKLREAVMLLLKVNPELKDILFDFSEPGKIDLEAFMNKNFHFNVDLNRFAYLTGRSLATFKRDFEKLFHNTPSRWLQQRRLQEAHYLIKEKGKTASDIYLDLGFEDLSHFSFAFKKQYGLAPSRV
ncbi:helix-turn-helix domain-containing protein [Mucilaginibacter ginsenosidivorans]|uniref:Helix-turn-helix transcriptional regulator n=1 Tax=Mucilaginibacter ginsenosidivorans TaxID=398053 RepID=A0A5B8V0J1_9SPHI|nr:AraC family transcriptional regulator [Mucilaginibacter ginsenosidivorans]QEC64323.1 helix-turn-helix transcriptional regulator [Mucilaginibacter ginsenosidivorans]